MLFPRTSDLRRFDIHCGDAQTRGKPAMAVFVSGCRVPQVRGIGLRAIHRVCEQADNKADVVPCDRVTQPELHKARFRS
jgi:hypothetical protein